MKSVVHLKLSPDYPFPLVRVWNHAHFPVSGIHPVQSRSTLYNPALLYPPCSYRPTPLPTPLPMLPLPTPLPTPTLTTPAPPKATWTSGPRPLSPPSSPVASPMCPSSSSVVRSTPFSPYTLAQARYLVQRHVYVQLSRGPSITFRRGSNRIPLA